MKTHPLILVFTLCFVASILSGQNPVLVLPVGHASYVENARFSMDSKYIVTSSADVKIWNVESGKLIHSLETKAPFVYDANYSPDGKYIVTASHDSTSEIWDVKSGELSSSLVGHLDAIFSSSYSLDGKQILTASNDKTAKLWDSKSGKLVHSLEGHKSALEYAKFSKDQKFILTVSSDSTAKIWDRNTGKLLHTLRAPKSQLRHARFSPDTKRILTVSSDSTARIWNVNSGKLLNGFVGIKQCVFSPDGKYLLATKDNMVSAIDAQTGDLIRTFDQQIGKFGVLEFSPDGKQILTTTFDKMGKNGNAQIWDFLSGRLVRTLEEAGGGYYISSACYSPDGKFILTASNKIVRIWDSQSGKLFQTLHGHTDGVSNAIYSPDLKYIAFGSGNTLKIWDALNGKVVHSMDEHKEIISDIKYSNDGSQILTASFDGTARLWDSKNGKLLSNFNHHDKLLTNVDYRPDENIVISRATTYDFRTRKTSIETYLWDVHSQKLIHKFDGVANYSPNNRNIVVGNEKSGQIFDSQTLELNYSLEGHSGRILSASYSLDGKIVITTSEDQTVKLWDAQSGKIIRTLEGHSGNVFAPIYDSNGKTIVTRSRDKSAIIWNLQNGEVIKKLAGHRAGVTQILYSPDGQAIITVDDYSVRSWNKSTGDLLSTTELNGASFEDMDWAGRKIVATQSSSMILFNMETGKEIVRWVIIDKSDWAVTHSSGLFDASPGAMDKLYYVQGMDFIEFNQLKTRYYEPGLWKKIMIGEDLRMVENYKAISLPPDITC